MNFMIRTCFFEAWMFQIFVGSSLAFLWCNVSSRICSYHRKLKKVVVSCLVYQQLLMHWNTIKFVTGCSLISPSFVLLLQFTHIQQFCDKLFVHFLFYIFLSFLFCSVDFPQWEQLMYEFCLNLFSAIHGTVNYLLSFYIKIPLKPTSN